MTPASRPRLHTLTLALALAVATAGCQATTPPGAPSPPGITSPPRDVEWRTYGGTYASARYSPLDQIDRTNVGQLHVAWRWRSPDHDDVADHDRR